MKKEMFCQRCAMPLENQEEISTNADGTKNEDYCCYCYKDGAFLYPEATMEDVIESCLPHVVPDVFADETIARAALNEHFPTLNCWKKTGMIVTFKLKDGVLTDDFLLASDKVQEDFVSKCKGFVNRQLMTIDGVWTDWIVWETLPDAINSMNNSSENEATTAFISLIGETIEHKLYPLERSY